MRMMRRNEREFHGQRIERATTYPVQTLWKMMKMMKQTKMWRMRKMLSDQLQWRHHHHHGHHRAELLRLHYHQAMVGWQQWRQQKRVVWRM